MKQKDKHSRSGKIIPNGVSLEKHELDTIIEFTKLGYDIELIPVSSTPHAKSPDIIISGKAWEIKSPIGRSKSTLEHSFKKAAKQSENIVIDIRRLKTPEAIAISQLKHLFEQSKRVKNMKIITKKRKILDFPGEV